jgi:hypothetical protein
MHHIFLEPAASFEKQHNLKECREENFRKGKKKRLITASIFLVLLYLTGRDFLSSHFHT